jgi:hypothetical protein
MGKPDVIVSNVISSTSGYWKFAFLCLISSVEIEATYYTLKFDENCKKANTALQQ